MKALMGVAVFGLVPVPPMSDTLPSSFDDRRTTSEDFKPSQLALLPRPIAERLTTKDELAPRIELEETAKQVAWRRGPDGVDHNGD